MKFLFKNKKLILSFAASIALLIVGLVVSFITFKDVDHLLIIHFDNFRGIDFLGSTMNVYEILAVGLFLIVLNMLLAWGLYERKRFFSFVLGYTSMLIAGLILVAIGVILSVNL